MTFLGFLTEQELARQEAMRSAFADDIRRQRPGRDAALAAEALRREAALAADANRRRVLLWRRDIPVPTVPLDPHHIDVVRFADGIQSSTVMDFRLRRIARGRSLALRRQEWAYQRGVREVPSPDLIDRVRSDVVTAEVIDVPYAHSLLTKSLLLAAVAPEAPKPETPWRDVVKPAPATAKLPKYLEHWPRYLPANHRPNYPVSCQYKAYPRPPTPMPRRCRLEDVDSESEASVGGDLEQVGIVSNEYRGRGMWKAYPRPPTPMYDEDLPVDNDDDDADKNSFSSSSSSSDEDDDDDNQPLLTVQERTQAMQETLSAALAECSRRNAEYRMILRQHEICLVRFKADLSEAVGETVVVKQVRREEVVEVIQDKGKEEYKDENKDENKEENEGEDKDEIKGEDEFVTTCECWVCDMLPCHKICLIVLMAGFLFCVWAIAKFFTELTWWLSLPRD